MQQSFGWGAIVLALIFFAVPGQAEAPPIPDYLKLPAQVHVKPNWTEEDYGEAEFIIIGQDDHLIKRGKHWNAGMTVSGVPDGADLETVWAQQIKPTIVQGGWTFFPDRPGQPKTARYQKNGHDSWIMLWLMTTDDIRLDLVEVGPLPPSLKLTLKKPAAKSEPVNVETGDFPYLSPIPGSSGGSGSRNDGPMMVEVDVDKDTHEQQAVGSGSIVKGYTLPPPLQSPLLFFTVYREALTQAGWKIVHQVQSVNGVDAVLNAHYTADGRDIWATLHGGGESYTIAVADAGTEDIGKQLDKECHIALYGINFDFNKATLRADSDPTLEKVLALLQARPELKLEIQGHTDNVGADDYNQKLSEARANAVVEWLRAKGIGADRITAQGYGMKMPIADNGSDEGRAKNRRVELKKQGCGT
jgi:OmpA-OmpF porin, OOP family